MLDDLCELPVFYRHSEPVARKQHKCCECSAPILNGERYFAAWCVWGGEAHTYRQHLACMEACMLIRDRFADGYCIGFGDLMETYRSGIKRQYSRHDKTQKGWQRLRHLLAVILWRERKVVKP